MVQEVYITSLGVTFECKSGANLLFPSLRVVREILVNFIIFFFVSQ